MRPLAQNTIKKLNALQILSNYFLGISKHAEERKNIRKNPYIFFTMFWASRTGTRAEKKKDGFFLYFSLLQHALIFLKNIVDRIRRTFDFFYHVSVQSHGPTGQKKIRCIFSNIFTFFRMLSYL